MNLCAVSQCKSHSDNLSTIIYWADDNVRRALANTIVVIIREWYNTWIFLHLKWKRICPMTNAKSVDYGMLLPLWTIIPIMKTISFLHQWRRFVTFIKQSDRIHFKYVFCHHWTVAHLFIYRFSSVIHFQWPYQLVTTDCDLFFDMFYMTAIIICLFL